MKTIRAQCTYIHLQAVLVAAMFAVDDAASLADIANAEFPLLRGLPVMFHKENYREQYRVSILASTVDWRAVDVVASILHAGDFLG